MKKYYIPFVFLILIVMFPVSAQIRIVGKVSVNINHPIPEVVIVKGRSKRPMPRQRRKPPVIVSTCNPCNHSFGAINNQNGPSGRYVYQVTNASLLPSENEGERIIYNLDTGEVLEIIIVTAHSNDYNYHYNKPDCNCVQHNNTILAILLNGKEIPLRDGSLSLQPRSNGKFHSVINLHSIYHGDFNGTINF
ncbi:hypothetical protein [Aquimarina megaterium]|uniref:hypothetical protein n=1 Tax=Aquimarina megaterium TaxID=1443666 RepID=UPI00047068CD|nr:hypothetical protein [Aquimarina megaterium]